VDEWAQGRADWVAYDAAVDGCRGDFAAIIGASPDEVALHPSFSIGIGLIAASLPAGAEVLVAPDEYGSVVWPMLVAARARGVVVREAPFESLAAAIRPETALVGVSLIQLHTGRAPDLDAILAAASAAGARVLVDASQAVPTVDVRQFIDRVDYLGCAGYKHLLGPHGTSFFYVRRDRLAEVEPWAANWVAADPAPSAGARYIGPPLVLRPDAGRFDTTFPRFPWIATAESLRLVRGWFEAGLFDEVRRLAARLASLVGLPPPAGSLVCVPVADEAAALSAVLGARVKAAARIGHIRFAPHLWSTDEDIERAAAAIEPHVSRR
jgi:selenocysteine lyase/cysteine desulfurase